MVTADDGVVLDESGPEAISERDELIRELRVGWEVRFGSVGETSPALPSVAPFSERLVLGTCIEPLIAEAPLPFFHAETGVLAALFKPLALRLPSGPALLGPRTWALGIEMEALLPLVRRLFTV